MRIFYDEYGNVTGTMMGATPEIEAAMGQPTGTHGELQLEGELVNRFNDPLDNAHPHDAKVLEGLLVLPDDKEARTTPNE